MTLVLPGGGSKSAAASGADHPEHNKYWNQMDAAARLPVSDDTGRTPWGYYSPAVDPTRRHSLTHSLAGSVTSCAGAGHDYSTCSVSRSGRAVYTDESSSASSPRRGTEQLDCTEHAGRHKRTSEEYRTERRPSVGEHRAEYRSSVGEHRAEYRSSAGGRSLQSKHDGSVGKQPVPSMGTRVSRHASYTAGCVSSGSRPEPLMRVYRKAAYSPVFLTSEHRKPHPAGAGRQPGAAAPAGDQHRMIEDAEHWGMGGSLEGQGSGTSVGVNSSGPPAVVGEGSSTQHGFAPVNTDLVGVSSLEAGLGARVRAESQSQDLEPVYEDIPDMQDPAPPRLAPLSGFLAKTGSDKSAVIRPIAFKPVTPTSSLPPPTPPHPLDMKGGAGRQMTIAADEGYASHDTSRSCSHNPYAQPYVGLAGLAEGSILSGDSRLSECSSLKERAGSSRSVDTALSERPRSRENYLSRQVPFRQPSSSSSPCESPTSAEERDYHHHETASRPQEKEEALLREKEAEIAHLRHTLEHNERVIFAVGEERQKDWHRQMGELAEEYGRRLHRQEGRARGQVEALRAELSRERARAEGLAAELGRAERECHLLRKAELQVQQYRAKCEEVDSKLTAKQAEMASLLVRVDVAERQATKADSLQDQLAETCEQIETLKKENTTLEKANAVSREELEKTRAELKTTRLNAPSSTSPTSLTSDSSIINNNIGDAEDARGDLLLMQEEVNKLRAQLNMLSVSKQSERAKFEKERRVWQAEKGKVLQYQHQLQLNYVQMYRRNAQLEASLSGDVPQSPHPVTHVQVQLDDATTESLC